jgi:hypothetical protein
LLKMLSIALPICHDCDRREPGCASECRCLVSGEPYVSHARDHRCPLGKFPPPSPGSERPESATRWLSLTVIDHRRELCGACSEGADSECRAILARGKPANILNGTARPDVVCPLGKWGGEQNHSAGVIERP